MIRVFHVISHFDQGGAERVAINIAKSNNRDFEYHIMEVAKTKGTFRKNLLQECKKSTIIIHTSPISNNKFAIVFSPLLFTWLLYKWKPAIVHTHTEVPDTALYLWHLLFGNFFSKIKYVRTIHNTQLWTNWNSIGKCIERFFKKEQANIAISIPVQESYNKEYGETPPIIFNGVEEIKQYPFPYIVLGKINILFAGRLEYQKGIDQLIEVVVALHNDDRFFFHIVGEGSLALQVDIAIGKLQNCKRYQKVYNLSSYMSSFDYLFMPSNFEGLALLPLEANMACLPTIINRCKGLKECLPPDWPLAVENNDVEAFIKIFRHLPDVNRKVLGTRAREYALQHFSLETMQRKYEIHYKTVLSE